MELLLFNTDMGLIPMYGEDFDAKRRLRLGESYKARISVARNIRFHRMFFALINAAWSFQSEKTQAFFHNSVEQFRKTVELMAGHYDTVYSVERKEWQQIPRSIAFDKMDEPEFRELYERIKDVLLSVFLQNIPERVFDEAFANFFNE